MIQKLSFEVKFVRGETLSLSLSLSSVSSLFQSKSDPFRSIGFWYHTPTRHVHKKISYNAST